MGIDGRIENGKERVAVFFGFFQISPDMCPCTWSNIVWCSDLPKQWQTSQSLRCMSLFRLYCNSLFKERVLPRGLGNYQLLFQSFEVLLSVFLPVVWVMPAIVTCLCWWCMLSVSGCLLDLLHLWSTGSQIGQEKKHVDLVYRFRTQKHHWYGSCSVAGNRSQGSNQIIRSDGCS